MLLLYRIVGFQLETATQIMLLLLGLIGACGCCWPVAFEKDLIVL